MADKSDIDSEVDELKKQLKKKSEPNARSESKDTSKKVSPESELKKDRIESETTDSNDEMGEIERVLKEHGLEADELHRLWEQLGDEFKSFANSKPLVTAMGLFLVGFLVGRITSK
ncbi:MAG: hypothetical protein ACR2PF_15775 [Rhizobiaceae bacterium]